MIDPNELQICKRRGHAPAPSTQGWTLCKFCGMWVREVYAIQEREDEPPKSEMAPLMVMQRMLQPEPKK